MYLGAEVLKFSSKLINDARTSAEKTNISDMLQHFRLRCRMFLQTACIQIQKRFDFDDKVLSSICIFDPSEVFKASTKTAYPSLVPLTDILPRCVQSIGIQTIDDESLIIF